MAYKALYRTYRPQTFDEVVGQRHIVQTLRNAINENKIAHAYLFTGPRGTGKTTIAKLLAKGVNCLGESNKPCGECANCLAIADGTYPDVIEIDAASNNGVDEIRELIDKVKYAPINGKYKVYIIDEVHMLSLGAFNALLKTLEEPPAHVIFILATTEVQKVLPTIISRCQRFDFGRVSIDDIKGRITKILSDEEVTFEKNVVSLIAELADGGMRDAISILDQAMAYSGKYIQEQSIRDIYGIASVEETVKFIDHVCAQDVQDALDMIEKFDHKGIDIIRFTSSLVDVLKEIIVYNETKNLSMLKELNEEQIISLSKKINSNRAFEFIDILVEATGNYRRVNSPRSFFELAALKLCNVDKNDASSPLEVIEKVASPVQKPVTIEKPVEVEKPRPIIDVLSRIVAEEVNAPIVTTPTPIVEEDNQKEIKKVEESKIESPVSKPIISSTSSNQDVIEIEEDEMFNILILAKKDDRAYAMERWGVLRSRYLAMPAYSAAVKLLIDGSPQAVADEGMIITYDFEYQANEINKLSNQLIIREFFMNELFGKQVYFYGVSTDRFQQLKLKYIDRLRHQLLPQAHPIGEPKIIHVETEEGTSDKEPKDKNVELGKSIFGELLDVKE